MTPGTKPMATGSQTPGPGSLLERIAAALDAAGVRYCQWKGHFKRARWISGEGDVDLLVDPAAWSRFAAELRALGLKRTVAPAVDALAGAESFWGHDPAAGALFHIHAATRLVFPDAAGNLYRLPVEQAMLAGPLGHGTFPTPPPALELIMFVVRTGLRHSVRDGRKGGLDGWRPVARAELDYLESRTTEDEVENVLREQVRWLDAALFQASRAALEPHVPMRRRLAVRRALAARLAGSGGRVRRAGIWSLTVRAVAWALRKVGIPAGVSTGARMAEGGTLIAIAGTDGSGKSTSVGIMRDWLRPHLRLMTAHLGRPPRSWLTLFIGGLRRVFGGPQLEWARYVCTARDRHTLAARAWRFALGGGIAITERYPLGPNYLLVGPRVRELAGAEPGLLARWLMRIEEEYYRRLPYPDHVFVLAVDPDVAVRRKTDEPADYVRARAEAMRDADWSRTRAVMVDASGPLNEVIADLQDRVWKVV